MWRNFIIVGSIILLSTPSRPSSDVIETRFTVDGSDINGQNDGKDLQTVTPILCTTTATDANANDDVIWQTEPGNRNNSTSLSSWVEFQTSTAPFVLDVASWQAVQLNNLYQICPPILIVVGTIGNLIATVSLQSRLFDKTPSTKFLLTTLALCDIFLLYTDPLRIYLEGAFNIWVRNYSSYGCKLHVFLTHVSWHLAPWAVVLLTIERAVAVYLPFHCKQLCSLKRILIAWLTIVIAIVATDFHLLFSYDLIDFELEFGQPGGWQCFTSRSWFWFVFGFYIWVDVLLADFIPFGVILIGNILIITKVIKSRRAFRHKTREITNKQQVIKSTNSATYVLILVSVYFLITRIPKQFYFLGSYFGLVVTWSFYDSPSIRLFYISVLMVYYSNCTMEFVFYFISGNKFRSAFLDVFRIRKLKSELQKSWFHGVAWWNSCDFIK